LKPLFNADDKAVTSQHVQKISLMKNVLIGSSIASMFALGANAVDETVALTSLTRADVGFINLNESLPTITDVCWLDLQIENSDPQRIEISLFGEPAIIVQYCIHLLEQSTQVKLPRKQWKISKVFARVIVDTVTKVRTYSE